MAPASSYPSVSGSSRGRACSRAAGDGVGGGILVECAVERIAQNLGDRAVAARVDRRTALACRLQPGGAVGLGELKNAETGPELLLGMRFGVHDHVDQSRGAGTEPGGKRSHSSRGPACVAAMRARHMYRGRRVTPGQRRARMRRHPMTGGEHLDRRIGDPGFNQLPD